MEEKTKIFFKSIALLSSGSIIAQVLNFIAAPVMTHFFLVEDIGLFTYITTIAYIFSPVICMRYETAIVLEQYEKDVYTIIKLCGCICGVLTLVVGIGYLLYFLLTGKYSYINYLPVLMCFLIISGIVNIFTSYNTWKRQYNILTQVSVSRATANLVTLILFGLFNLSFIGLLFGHFISQCVGLWQQGKSIYYSREKIYRVKWQIVIAMARKYKGLAIYSVPAIFFNNASYLSVNFFISDLYGVEQLAFYALSFRVLGVPLSLISNNIGSVFYEQASREYAENKTFKKLYIKTLCMLISICIPIIGIIYYVAPGFCSIYFGEQWYVAGIYIQIMCILFAVRFVVAPLTAGILILKKNKLEMVCQSCFFLVSLLTYFFSTRIYALCIDEFLLVISTGFAVVYFMFGLIIYKLS